jgi:thiol-disulfide isomerase/thioredoxin
MPSSRIPRVKSLPFALLAGLGAAAAAGSGCATAGRGAGGADETAGAATQGIGQPMPDIVVSDMRNGREIRLSDLRGKVVLLDIWASWCAPCKEEMPVLDEIARRLRPSGVEVLAVSIDEDKESAERFLRDRKSWALTLAHDPQGRVPERLQPPKMPTSYVIDARGVLRYVNSGYERGDGSRLEAKLRSLAAER